MRLENVTVLLGPRPVLRDVDVEAEPGRVLALVGPNGAGKSTLLRAAAGLLPLQRGRVRWGELDVHALPHRERARLLSYVPQESPLDYPFTVREVVTMGRYAHRTRMGGPAAHDADAVRRALDDLNLTALADRPVTRLSGGERKRVALARAVAQDPRVLLLDEPTASLDLGQAHHVHRVLRRLADAGTCVVVVMHDLETAARTADRVVLLADGEVAAAGTPREVLTPESIQGAFAATVDVKWSRDGDPRVRVVDAP